MKVVTNLLVLCLFLATVYGQSGVPVLLWKDKGVSTMFKPALAGHTLTSKQFELRYLEDAFHSGASNILVFKQNKLSLEDFTKYGNVYGGPDSDVYTNVKNYMLQPSAVSLPAVRSPLKNLNAWAKQLGWSVTELTSASEVADMEIKAHKNVVVVTLPTGQGSRKDELASSDQLIGDMIKKVGQDFVAMYTGQEVSSLYTVPESDFSGRHLLEVSEGAAENYTLINKTDCPLVYFTDMKLLYREFNTDRSLKENCTIQLPRVLNLDDVKCPNATDTTKTMEIMYTVDGLNVSFAFQFDIKLQFWTTAINVTLDGKCPDTSTTLNKEFALKDVPFEGPQTFSYHCNATPSVVSVPQDGGRFKLDVMLKGFQIQPFYVMNSKFGRPNECIGFFSIPIFMGLAVALVLLSITFFGICMLSDIKTNDQFDDPKGKTITVVSDD